MIWVNIASLCGSYSETRNRICVPWCQSFDSGGIGSESGFESGFQTALNVKNREKTPGAFLRLRDIHARPTQTQLVVCVCACAGVCARARTVRLCVGGELGDHTLCALPPQSPPTHTHTHTQDRVPHLALKVTKHSS